MDDPQSKEATDIMDMMASTSASTMATEDTKTATPAATDVNLSSPASTALQKQQKSTNSDAEHPDEISASSDITDVAIAATEENFFHGDYEEEINAAPGHLHALSRIPDARLRGIPRHHSDGKLMNSSGSLDHGTPGKGGRRSRSTSRSRAHGSSGRRSANSSRSSSPLPSGRHHDNPNTGGGEAGSYRSTGNRGGDASTLHSGHSSLDGMFDPDLLLDRLGFIDLDPPLPHEIRCGPLAAPGTIDGKSNNSGGLTPVNERLSEETLDDCHAFNDLLYIDNLKHVSATHGGIGMSSTLSMPSVAHSSLSGMRSDMSVGSGLSVGSFKGGHG
eukprot:CAMPEP_0201911600 /NCGR_PEP_ID=MMETSP0903-20130614/2482_1 /ASSEMBLY_ACC=CAM_ASM_000552 /TAXON_ID=420261 /ORGANISM="Thalassiosira antarctica, Strain CCMP982" /LENGTH=330 /DNA_ID=CAMNT_0048446335 /DNA_START=260 /DNA_END=1248 /DNA_ORIENTATION=+